MVSPNLEPISLNLGGCVLSHLDYNGQKSPQNFAPLCAAFLGKVGKGCRAVRFAGKYLPRITATCVGNPDHRLRPVADVLEPKSTKHALSW